LSYTRLFKLCNIFFNFLFDSLQSVVYGFRVFSQNRSYFLIRFTL